MGKLAILLLGIATCVIGGFAIGLSFGVNNNVNVEEYCATSYSHSVKDYKACKDLTQTELIAKLTKDFGKENPVPTLEIIPSITSSTK